MKFSLIASAFALATAVSAGPTGYGAPQCISQKQAEHWIKTFIGVLGQTDPNAAKTADRIIADDFVEYSNSILSLQHKPLVAGDNVSAPNKAAWINGVLHAPAAHGINTQAVIVGCTEIVWKWDFTGVGSSKFPVSGMNYFNMKYKGKQLQAEALHLEFDSIAWGLDSSVASITYQDHTTVTA